tara:strand:- start:475 stop:768 length:294 start_codon:yes stop_codon:yes gene_type:complete
VPKVKKSARGKHRWVGFQLDFEGMSRDKCEDFLSGTIENIPIKLFDYKKKDSVCYGVIKVSLEHYQSVKEILNQQVNCRTLTSSGKIKLVRERLGLK